MDRTTKAAPEALSDLRAEARIELEAPINTAKDAPSARLEKMRAEFEAMHKAFDTAALKIKALDAPAPRFCSAHRQPTRPRSAARINRSARTQLSWWTPPIALKRGIAASCVLSSPKSARLGQYDRLTIMRINVRRPQEPAILFSRCLPRPPEQTNPLFENPRLVQATWNEEFAQALESALRSAGSGGPQRASPIIAGLRAVGADPDFGQEIPRRRLVLVSDLLEHNPQGFSLYVSDADYTAGRASSPNGPPNFARVELRIVPIDRPDNAERQAIAVEAFWPAFFDAADVQSVSMDPAP